MGNDIERYRAKTPWVKDKVAKLYEKSGDDNYISKRKKDALDDYQAALKNADSPERKKRLSNKIRGLQRLLAYSSIACFVVSIFFVSLNLTGSAINESLQNNSLAISVAAFVLGLVFVFFYFMRKRQVSQ